MGSGTSCMCGKATAIVAPVSVNGYIVISEKKRGGCWPVFSKNKVGMADQDSKTYLANDTTWITDNPDPPIYVSQHIHKNIQIGGSASSRERTPHNSNHTFVYVDAAKSETKHVTETTITNIPNGSCNNSVQSSAKSGEKQQDREVVFVPVVVGKIHNGNTNHDRNNDTSEEASKHMPSHKEDTTFSDDSQGNNQNTQTDKQAHRKYQLHGVPIYANASTKSTMTQCDNEPMDGNDNSQFQAESPIDSTTELKPQVSGDEDKSEKSPEIKVVSPAPITPVDPLPQELLHALLKVK